MLFPRKKSFTALGGAPSNVAKQTGWKPVLRRPFSDLLAFTRANRYGVDRHLSIQFRTGQPASAFFWSGVTHVEQNVDFDRVGCPRRM